MDSTDSHILPISTSQTIPSAAPSFVESQPHRNPCVLAFINRVSETVTIGSLCFSSLMLDLLSRLLWSESVFLLFFLHRLFIFKFKSQKISFWLIFA
ncbi:unnamed protein product [Brassica rapa subsp. trilocularis]